MPNPFSRRISPTARRASLALLMLSAVNALAGQFHETDGVAINGFDPVAYITERKAVPGDKAYIGVHKGSTFHFKDAANRDAFIANPERFAPQYGGFCAFGVSRGYKAVTSPDAFTVIDGKLYLNYNAEVKAMWSKDVSGYVSKADSHWPTVQKTTKVNR